MKKKELKKYTIRIDEEIHDLLKELKKEFGTLENGLKKLLNFGEKKMIKEEMINGMIELIKSLPDSDKHIYESEGQFFVTNEWLVGNFAGRSFNSNTIEGAIKQLIIHCNGHLGHNSIAGDCITKSGYPDLVSMGKFLNS